MKKYCYSALAVALLSLSTTNQASTWSDTAIGVSYGKDFSEPFKNQANGEAVDIEKFIFTLIHASGYQYGSNFFQINMHQSSNEPNASKASGKGAQEAYVIYRHTLDFPKVFNQPLSEESLISSYGLTMGFDWNTKNDDYGSNRQMWVVGPSMTFNVPGYLGLSFLGYFESNDANVLEKKYTYDPYLAVQLNWDFPIQNTPVNFQGIGVWMTSKGTNEFGGKTDGEIFLDTALMYDFGKHLNFSSGAKLKAGVAYQYWKNKYGNSASGAAGKGATASSPMLRVMYHF